MSIYNPILNNGENQATDPVAYTSNVIQTVFSIFFIVAVIYFLWHFVMGGYHFIASEGDQKKIETAKSQLTYAFVGLFVVFCVFAILKLIGAVTGIQGLESLQITWPTL